MMAPDNLFNVYVTHVVDTIDCNDKPNFCNIIFWGQKPKDRSIAAKLEENIAACSFHSLPSPTLTDLKRDKLYCVQVNNSWLRASVDQFVFDRIGMLEVFCVDYGSIQNVPLGFLRLIPQNADFVRTCPPLASKFLLADVVIAKGPLGKEPVRQYLMRQIANKTVQVLSLGQHEDFEGVRVYFNNQLVAKQLVDNQLVVSAATYLKALQDPLPNQSSTSSGRSSPRNSAELSLGTRHLDLIQVKAIGDGRSSSMNNQNGGGVCTYLASLLDPDVKQLVMVTNVTNGPERFTVQVKSTHSELQLTILSQKVSAFANSTPKKLNNPVRGTPCIAVSSRDRLFHRGLVTAVEHSMFLNIYFVDYGYNEIVNQDLLYEISSELMSIDLHAIRVSLAGAAELMDREGISEIFTRMVLNKTFDCQVSENSLPQSVTLFDDTGRPIKDLLAAAAASCHNGRPLFTNLLRFPNSSPAIAPRPSSIKMDVKIPPVKVESEEKLYVTFVGPPGHFFGQFEKRPTSDLLSVAAELVSFYENVSPTTLPLLYSDLETHLGDYGVIKWSSDNHMYRVKIVEENPTDVVVSLVDYGNKIKVHRKEVWAPVKGLKLFLQEPFGIHCSIPGVEMSEDEWETKLLDRSVCVVVVGSPIDNVFTATFKENKHPNGKSSDSSKMASLLSPEARPWMPKSEPTGNGFKPMMTLKFNQPLFDDEYEESVKSSLGFNGMAIEAEDSGQNGSSTTVESLPTSSQSVEDRLSRKRSFPIAEPISTAAVFYPEQPTLEGQTRNLEIVFVDSPNSFYCQLVENSATLTEMMSKLASVYADESKPCLTNAQVGAACVAKYLDDDGWYRGKIVEVDGTEIVVLFVDYGNQQRSPLHLAKIIDEEFVALPAQSYHCSLKGVPESRAWTLEEKTRFADVAMGKTLSATTFSLNGKGGKLPVRLRSESADGSSLVINELFGALSTNVSVPDEPYTALPVESVATNVIVAWFCRVDRFFLSPVDLAPFQKELDRLEEFYSALTPSELEEDEPAVGLPCVVKYLEDGLYYRSRITSIDGDTAEVLFVDYGNSQKTPLNELKRIHPEFMKFPQLTWECRLKGAKLVSNVTGEMKRHIDACFLNGGAVSALLTPHQCGVFNAELGIPELGDATGYLLQHGVVVLDDVEVTPQNLAFVLDESRRLSAHAIIPFVKSPSEFWIQLEPDAVESLMERIDELATQPDFIHQKPMDPSVGKYCLAFFADDGRWYRAVIEAVNGDTSTVYYIDYGNTATVANTNIKRLPENVADLPAMAFKSCLDGGTTYTKEINDKFQQLALDLVVSVYFVRVVDRILHVRLVTADGTDLADQIGLSAGKDAGQTELDAYVAYAVTPSQFWIQKKRDEEKLADIQDELFQLFDGPDGQSFRLAEPPVVGQLYAANHPLYSTWFRSRVTSLDPPKSVQVQFIDYGDTHTVPVEDIRRLADELKAIPPLAVRCCLNMEMADREWSEEACKTFNEACSSQYVCQLVLGHFTDNIQRIDSMRSPAGDVFDMLAPLTKPPRNKLLDKVIDLIETISSAKDADSPPIIRSSAEWIKDSTAGQLLSSKASAVCISSPFHVWIQLEPEAADAITADIQRYIDAPEFTNQSVLSDPFVGCSCLALFSDDNQWYRAKIESVNADSVFVKYVDFGNTSSVRLEDLRVIPQSLVQQPAMALRCALEGADPDSSSSSPPTSAQCQDVLFGQTLSVTLIEKTFEYPVVRLCDAVGNDLNAKLGLVPPMSSNGQDQTRTDESIPGAVEVRVSYAKSAHLFWIQRKSDEQVIEQIRDNLRPLDGDSTDSHALPADLKEGELYAVMHPEYNRFYRGRVQRIERDTVVVFFIDFGQTHWSPLANVRPCPAILKYIPPMAIECTFLRTAALRHPHQVTEELLHRAFCEATEGVVCQAVCDGVQPNQATNWTLKSLYAKGVEVTDILSRVSPSPPAAAAQSANPNNFDNCGGFSMHRQRGL